MVELNQFTALLRALGSNNGYGCTGGCVCGCGVVQCLVDFTIECCPALLSNSAGTKLFSGLSVCGSSRVAQWKRAGLITQRSMDRNHSLLCAIFCLLSLSCFGFGVPCLDSAKQQSLTWQTCLPCDIVGESFCYHWIQH